MINAWKDNPWIIAAVFLLGGLFLQRIFDEVTKPNIKLKIGETAVIKRQGKPDTKFLHITVENKIRNIVSKILRKNNTTSYTKANLIFKYPNSKAEILRIVGRWTSKKEPVDYQTNLPDIGEALLVPREVIPAGEEVNLAIALKEDGSKEFYAFNNESYLHNWKHPDYELTDKEYLLEVEILSEGNVWRKSFSIINSGSHVSNFRIS